MYLSKNSPDNIYQNIRISGGNDYDSNYAATYNVNKTIPIVNKGSDYYLSVVSMSIPTDEIPILTATPLANQPDPNTLQTGLGIEYNGITYFTRLTFIPQGLGVGGIVNPPVQNQPEPVVNPYYFIYSITPYLTMINNALAAMYTASGLDVVYPGVKAPFVYLNETTNRLVFVVGEDLVALYTAGTFNILFNEELVTYLNAFSTYYNETRPDAPYELVMTDSGNTCNENGGSMRENLLDTYRFYSQEFYGLSNWVSLNRIIVTSNTIPINGEFLSGRVSQGASDQSVTMPILMEFQPDILIVSQARTGITYSPSAQYRLVDITSENPITNLNIVVYWEDMSGRLFPLYVSPYKCINIKIGFFKKSLYKN